MSTLLKKLLLSFLSSLIIFLSIVPNFLAANAATPAPSAAPSSTNAAWYNSSFKEWFSKVYDENVSPGSEIFGERYTAAQVQWVIFGVWAFIINGIVPPRVSTCFLGSSVDLSVCASAVQSLLASNTQPATIATRSHDQNLLSLVFASNRSLSGISYVSDRLKNFSIVPTAHAQTVGFGFSALEPIQGMWRGFRDIAYGLFVIAAIVFAFMIMFRVKISPQVVITIQSAIPKLIIALILVTFSYAIAGFLVDLMYVVIGILSVAAGSIFSFGVGPISFGAPQYFSFLTLGQPLGNILPVQAGVAGIFLLLGGYLLAFVIALGVLLFYGLGALNAIAFSGLLTILFLILIIVVAIMLIFISFKTIWALLKAFAKVILLVILGPFQILFGVLVPSFGFGAWVKSFIAALSTFVVTGALILFSFIFLIEGIAVGLGDSAGHGLANSLVHLLLGDSGAGSIPGIISSGSPSWPPLLGSSGTGYGLLLLGVSFVAFTLIPKATEIVQGFLTGKPFAYGSAVGEAMGPGVTAARAGTSYAVSEYESTLASGKSTIGSLLRTVGFIKK